MADRINFDDIELPVERPGSSRRSFLKLAGFGVAATTLASCSRGPVRLAVPRLEPTGTVPGRAYEIATTCGGCEARCGVLARCRDGRPVKLEGNPLHAASLGGLCAVGQASLLDLYDGRRHDGPQLGGSSASWPDLDAKVAAAVAAGGGVRVLTRTITSPSTRAWIAKFVDRTGGTHVEWDPRSASALLDAHEACLGTRVVPNPRFDSADLIVSFDADFLGTWISPVAFAKAYSRGRDPGAEPPRMSRHVQFESRLSLTGAAADERHQVAPWELRPALAALCAALGRHGQSAPSLGDEGADAPRAEAISKLADDLWAVRGKCLVVCGSDDPGTQGLAVLANQLLGNYGKTLDLERPCLARRGDDAAMARLIEEMAGGQVKLLVVDGLDPAYELPDAAGFREALVQVELVVSTSALPDETAGLAHAVAPTLHELESWNDAEAVSGQVSFSQPTVPSLKDGRTLRASLAAWMGEAADERTLLREHWRAELSDAKFDRALHDGYVRALGTSPSASGAWNESAFTELLRSSPSPTDPGAGSFALILYPKVGLPEGRNAHNPWLQELPDPLTTVTWDNYAWIAPETAAELHVEEGDIVRVGAPDGTPIELPVWISPGVHPRVVAVALGYGVSGTDRFSRIGPSWIEERLTVRKGGVVGRRAAALLELAPSGMRTSGRAVRMEVAGGHEELATTQDHHRLEVPEHLAVPRGAVRDAVLTTSFGQLRDDPAHAIHEPHVPEVDLWPADHSTNGPRWGMVIDLSACNGCSGCVVACQAENNVPAVGKDEVRRHREMTWLRVDRYFQGEGDDLRMVHQPMMCQHCANAPCETVCPVLATVHSEDGLNQQVYNRCVGTRYCANNCPYKTRRFNWFDYPRREELRNLALNPDVTVRTRGVMEKCSMCVQRIQETKAEAKRQGVAVEDGDIQLACQQSCPVDAISFGDLNDPESRVSKLTRSPRAYTVLPELNVRPGVGYLADVVNSEEEGGRHE